MHRRACVVALAVLLGLSGVVVPTGTAVAEDGAPPDPSEDVIGWENGYWHDEQISINQTDGLSAEERSILIARTMARIEHLRQLEFEQNVSVSVTSREAFRRETQNRTVNETLRVFDNVKFEALFLVNESTDSIAVQNQNSAVGTLGYYDFTTDEIVVIAPNETAVTMDEGTLAHELMHALQDQHFNLSNYSRETRDQANAISGLVEGDAHYVEYLYVTERCNNPDHPWNGTCVRPPDAGTASGELGNIGVYFLKYQPYSDGPTFIERVRQLAGWEAVNTLYADPPESTEQVIHPGKYGSDPPTDVTLVDETTASWARVRPAGRADYAEFGQAGIASMLVYPLYDSRGRVQTVSPRAWLNYESDGSLSRFDPLNYGFGAAAGWDGDRLHVYQNLDNQTAYVWRISWDSRTDAEEFLAVYERVLDYWGGTEVEPGTYVLAGRGYQDAVHVDLAGATVTITNAPTVKQLPQLRFGIKVETPTPSPTEPIGAEPTASPTGNSSPPTRYVNDSATPRQPGFGAVVAVLALLLASRLFRGGR